MSVAETVVSRGSESRPERALTTAAGDFSWRVLILLNLFRLTVAALLLAVFYFVDTPRIIGETNPEFARNALIGLLGMGLIELILLQRRLPGPNAQAFLQFAGDLAAVSLLIHASGGISSGLGGVLIISVGTLSLLVGAERAFLLAAVTALALLLEQTFAQFEGMTTSAQFAPTGILGAVVFVITGVVQLLRNRIVETEALAEQRSLDLRNQVELNEYIVQHLRESIVVVDSADQIRLINESAARHLSGGAPDENLAAVSPELAKQLQIWRARNAAAEKTTVTLGSADGSTTINPHFAPLGNDRGSGVVIFLEDTSLIGERVQQAKLAALGRLSASIAHEIRNPIGAMSHAGQLLAENEHIGREEQRLTDIIRVNARRVSQIVESVLALSRRGETRPEDLQVVPWLEDFAREFVETLELYEGAVSVAYTVPEMEAQIDPTHLHQIVWNLCDNAVKHASAAAGAIAVELRCGYLESSGRGFLEVADRGAGIRPDKIEEIFEPFFTDQPGGTGLGLYISRELAERNGATLRYYPRAGGGSVFRVVFADRSRWHVSKEVI